MTTPNISFIIVGHNAGKNLDRSLKSILHIEPMKKAGELIYVDANSLDNSIFRAKQYHAKIIETPSKTLADGKNNGCQKAAGSFLLYIDAQAILNPSFVNRALTHFNDSSIAAVVGEVEELYPEATLYHRLLTCDKKLSHSSSSLHSGNLLIKKDVLHKINGYDEQLVYGEMNDLYKRLQEAGYTIEKLDIPMCKTETEIESFRQLFHHYEKAGYAYEELSHKYFKDRRSVWRWVSLYNWLKGGALLGFPLWAISSWFFEDLYWPIFATLFVIIFLSLRITWKIRSYPYSLLTKIAYGFHHHFKHIPLLMGQVSYWWYRYTRKRAC